MHPIITAWLKLQELELAYPIRIREGLDHTLYLVELVASDSLPKFLVGFYKDPIFNLNVLILWDNTSMGEHHLALWPGLLNLNH